MDRMVTVKLQVELKIRADEGVEIGDIVNEMDYNFSDTTTKATIEDTEILDYEVTDSK
jgi:hypothetical protein